ncbi:DUF2442 domain-containing protein [Pontibacter pamirensis]|uniref:DUF2442 domain-containing protein n=1 Tax=Pontibacter pamirensis TaxID=2562824 RepID=UPI001389E8BD|nr:DUF2442 domain-containing protein [Pontibacter pamirensis]
MENIWITKAEYIRDYHIELEFNDGSSGIVDLTNELNKPIYKPLNDINYFKNFTLNSWTIEWENGADFAPEFLYARTIKNVAQQTL